LKLGSELKSTLSIGKLFQRFMTRSAKKLDLTELLQKCLKIFYFMVDIRRPIYSIESGVLYPPIISLDCDHLKHDQFITVHAVVLATLKSFALW